MQADQMGYLKLANAKIDSVQVQAAGMQPLNQALGRKPIGPIVILMKKEHSDKIHFVNEKWQLKGRRIIASMNHKQIIFKKSSQKDYYRLHVD